MGVLNRQLICKHLAQFPAHGRCSLNINGNLRNNSYNSKWVSAPQVICLSKSPVDTPISLGFGFPVLKMELTIS